MVEEKRRQRNGEHDGDEEEEENVETRHFPLRRRRPKLDEVLWGCGDKGEGDIGGEMVGKDGGNEKERGTDKERKTDTNTHKHTNTHTHTHTQKIINTRFPLF